MLVVGCGLRVFAVGGELLAMGVCLCCGGVLLVLVNVYGKSEDLGG